MRWYFIRSYRRELRFDKLQFGLVDLQPMEGHSWNDGHIGRRHPASGVHAITGEPTIVYVTVVAHGRENWIAQPLVHCLLRETWREAGAWLVGFYVLMPDHLHLFGAPYDPGFTFDQWVTFWKRLFRRKLNAHLERARDHPDPPGIGEWGVRYLNETDREFQEKWVRRIDPVTGRKVEGSKKSHLPLVGDPARYRWQEGKPWDTRLRRAENYEQKWRYVRENPLRAGLVDDAAAWPYQGMLNVLRW